MGKSEKASTEAPTGRSEASFCSAVAYLAKRAVMRQRQTRFDEPTIVEASLMRPLVDFIVEARRLLALAKERTVVEDSDHAEKPPTDITNNSPLVPQEVFVRLEAVA